MIMMMIIVIGITIVMKWLMAATRWGVGRRPAIPVIVRRRRKAPK